MTFLDDFVITPVNQTAKATSTGLGAILNNFTLWVVALTGIVTVVILMPLVRVMPAMLILTICVAALVIGIYLHIDRFGWEYRLSTWQNNLQFYGSITLLVLVIMLSLGFYYYNTNPEIRAVADAMMTRATSAVSDGTRGFLDMTTRGPTVSRR